MRARLQRYLLFYYILNTIIHLHCGEWLLNNIAFGLKLELIESEIIELVQPMITGTDSKCIHQQIIPNKKKKKPTARQNKVREMRDVSW